MEWLNYHHLLYFWTVAREGSVVRASEVLRLAQPTVSGQVKLLEEQLGEKLFRREGRKLVLTDVGRVVYRYADEIFSLGRELLDTLKDRPTGQPLRLTVGVADVVPKLVAHRLLQPAFQAADRLTLFCREDKPERLLAQLALHEIDVVLADSPVHPSASVRAHSHLLGECGVTLFGAPALAARYAAGFPQSLEGAPLLLPSESSGLRRSLDVWLYDLGVRPQLRGEFDDSALMSVFAEAGVGLFFGATVVERETCEQHGVQVVARVDAVRERFYAISVERRVNNPAVVAITQAARELLEG